jgi:hypothetical protein
MDEWPVPQQRPDGARSDCVVDAGGDAVVVWHVNTGPDLGTSRMAGAWVIDVERPATIEKLVARRRALVTADGEKALDVLGVSIHAYIDPAATISELKVECDKLQAVYDARPRRRGLVTLEWPLLPAAADLEPVVVERPPRQRVLGLARWLEKVTDCWDGIEGQRVVRKYLPGGPHRRPTPLAVRLTSQ